MLVRIAWESLRYRKHSVLLTIFAIALSVSMLLSVEHIRGQLKQSFTRTVSGVDLIVGARTSQLNLLLYSVFRMGNPTGAFETQDIAYITENPNVKWTIPLALGDSHKGFRVVGTTNAYFEHFRYGDKQPLALSQGDVFTRPSTAVLGANVAAQLGYKTGTEFTLSHGLGEVSFSHHDDYPITVTGVLFATGTPVDDAVYVTLSALHKVHATSVSKSLRRPQKADAQHHHDSGEGEDEDEDEDDHDISETKLSAMMVGLKTPVAALQLQYQIGQDKRTPLMAILPGVALNELWQLMGNAEKLLLGLSVLILISSLVGMSTMMLSSMRERYQEIAVLRATGAGALTILFLIQLESLLISIAACVVAYGFVSGSFYLLADFLQTEYGIFVTGSLATSNTLLVVCSVMLATLIIGFIPALSAYRHALHSGLTAR